jgi:MoaA/NifB/PqqE/SkfB family radical SAM enzyme
MAAQKIDSLRNVDFVAISIDSLGPSKDGLHKRRKGFFGKSLHTVETLQKEGIKVAVTPTISQLNLNEIVDITNYFTQKGVPVWYCLYSYDMISDVNQLFRIGKAQNEFVIKGQRCYDKALRYANRNEKEKPPHSNDY